MMEFRVLSATGVLGSGFMESSFEREISLIPHVIAPRGREGSLGLDAGRREVLSGETITYLEGK